MNHSRLQWTDSKDKIYEFYKISMTPVLKSMTNVTSKVVY